MSKPNYMLFIAYVARGKVTNLMDSLRPHGCSGATYFYGESYSQNKLMETLGLHRRQKEVLVSIMTKDIESRIHQVTREFFDDHSPNGFAFSMDVNFVRGFKTEQVKGESNKSMYKALFVIVDRGIGEEVISIASKHGAKGATVLHGRGSGIEKKKSFFDLVIEPEKDMVLFLIKEDRVKEISDAIEKEMEIENPGKGIMFAMDVNMTSGLFE